MRRLLLASLLVVAASAPAAHAGPGACVVASGFPVCAGTCSTGDPVNVVGIGSGSAVARCGGNVAAQCFGFRGACSGSGTAPSGGALTCGGTAAVVICIVGVQLT